MPAGSDITSYRREEKKRLTCGPESRPFGASRAWSPELAARSSVCKEVRGDRWRRPRAGGAAAPGGHWRESGRRRPLEPPVGGGRRWKARPAAACWDLSSSPRSPDLPHFFFFFLKNLPEDSLHFGFSTLYVCEAFLLYFALTFLLSRPLPTRTPGSANAPFGNC